MRIIRKSQNYVVGRVKVFEKFKVRCAFGSHLLDTVCEQKAAQCNVSAVICLTMLTVADVALRWVIE